mmetsp:Transcript_10795/g.19575  ORF Transcript_10795/g.19575 Transcript_10795/m.19575 type:complete len:182 (-) Transcript_10795:64-609(-)|eukprot:CAMPEP_0201920356 /NCGR_PEP_ID=MMETSP0903-20130614/8990_1 /ASSEMBLY_ACC=CAM_ASM_000552 /TAXON_ID=420261 /ORGANISM="Thalassiosira antarctica, Strain CCMP982" /LENGTH=181 /DNA_ID=CAMNT_0048457079 /DNA_START=367 /DNA_END=912 /DNA_ORIENTATION=-
MPPKKSKKKAAKGSNEDLDGMQIALPEDRIKYMESQTQALEMQLAYRSEATANAVVECETIRQELADATQKYEDEKQMSIDVTRSMTRQYKGMQEELLNKINERERIIETLKDELETLKRVHKEQIAQKDDIIQCKDADAEKQRVETENMCKHFANMLVDARLKIANHTQASDVGSLLEGS